MTPATLPSETAAVRSSDQSELSETDRSRLYTCIHSGRTTARVRTRAQVLLKLGAGWSLAEVWRAFEVCRNTAVRVRARFAEGGVDAVLSEQRQTRYRAALSGSHRHCVQPAPSSSGRALLARR
jgi:hypothetical protein